MAISIGFFKHVLNWLTDAEAKELMYRPFETTSNPYKADVFIVGAHPTPIPTLQLSQLKEYANGLVNRADLYALFPEYLSYASREIKGAMKLVDALEEQGISAGLSYTNAVMTKNLTTLKQLKKENEHVYTRGKEIFREVIQEIEPSMLVLHGAHALGEFREAFENYFVEYGHKDRKLDELDGSGAIGKIIHDNGKETIVFVTKSLATFKVEDEKNQRLIEQLKNTKSS
jgi:hypothetical protein